MKESRDAIAALQARWPAAFPKQGHLVRPLVSGIIGRIAEATDWPPEYARAVVGAWKARDAYCQAVLRHAQRYDLDGVVSEQTVDDKAREQARQRSAKNLAARTQWQEKAKATGKGDSGNKPLADAAE